MKILSAIGRAISRFIDPVCQDWGASRYDYYKGHLVRMIPVADPSNPERIGEWKFDPDRIVMIDLILKEEAEAKKAKEAKEAAEAKVARDKAEAEIKAKENPVQTTPAVLPSAPAPTFNPAGMGGL